MNEKIVENYLLHAKVHITISWFLIIDEGRRQKNEKVLDNIMTRGSGPSSLGGGAVCRLLKCPAQMSCSNGLFFCYHKTARCHWRP